MNERHQIKAYKRVCVSGPGALFTVCVCVCQHPLL